MEIGTLTDLNVKPGDVVECVRGRGCAKTGDVVTVADDLTVLGWRLESINKSLFRVVARASPVPKLWRDMTPEEKGALLLAKHEGRTIQFYNPATFLALYWSNHDFEFGFRDHIAYRICPTPTVKTVDLYLGELVSGALLNRVRTDTHRITFNIVDGIKDCSSIRMVPLTDKESRK